MAILVGMDEAGYGPNLGPLVVAATVWKVGQEAEALAASPTQSPPSRTDGGLLLATTAKTDSSSVDLYARLAGTVANSPSGDQRLAIADSKRLYKPGKGLKQLERGVLAALAAGGQSADRWQALTDFADPEGQRHALPWYANFDCPLPIDATDDQIAESTALLREGCRSAAVEVIGVRARMVFPAEFNRLTLQHGTKGAALSHITLALLKNVLDASPPEPCSITCDKHGGRNRYGPLLQHHFSDEWVETLDEGRAASHYQWGPPECRTTVSFRVGGEAALPTALASMTAKYLRELAMRAFNSYWAGQVADLRPTAGYPVDARRFKQEIAATQHKLRISDEQIWRNR